MQGTSRMGTDMGRTYVRAVSDGEKDEILRRLEAVWKANPELRFMQLLGNVFRTDPYNVEDYDMITELEEAYRM